MAYSSIKRKNCKCSPDCPKPQSFGFSGFYYSHAPQEIKDRNGEKSKKSYQAKAKRARISYLSRKVYGVQNEVLGSQEAKIKSKGTAELQRWFLERMNICEVKCENCGAENWWLSQNKELKGKQKWKSCQAHLLPKRHFDSIKSHPLNGMVMGTGFSGLCYCHDNYDSSWEKAAKMPIWNEVVRRFKIMYPLITQKEHQYIPEVLLKELN